MVVARVDGGGRPAPMAVTTPASDGDSAEPGEPEGNVDIGPDEAPKQQVVARKEARKEARVVGAGRGVTSLAPQGGANTDWSSVGRNDPCPCGSGKKFKKCHGATF